MLSIEIFGYGNEFYKVDYEKNTFDEKKFIKDHGENYYELKEDSFDQLLANVDRLTIIVNLNNKEVFNQEGKLGKELKVLLEKEITISWRDFAESDANQKTVIWGHGGIISNRYIFNNVNEFSINKLKVFRMKLIDSNDKDVGDEFITGIQYDSKDPDDEEPDFNPKHGYWGPKVY